MRQVFRSERSGRETRTRWAWTEVKLRANTRFLHSNTQNISLSDWKVAFGSTRSRPYFCPLVSWTGTSWNWRRYFVHARDTCFDLRQKATCPLREGRNCDGVAPGRRKSHGAVLSSEATMFSSTHATAINKRELVETGQVAHKSTRTVYKNTSSSSSRDALIDYETVPLRYAEALGRGPYRPQQLHRQRVRSSKSTRI